jgi:protein ImuA
MLGNKAKTIEALKARIEDLEKRPPLAETIASFEANGGFPAASAGLLHEVFADDQRDAGATLGFALGQARPLLSSERPAILVLQLAHDGQNIGIPYGVGLASFGIDPQSVVLGRVETAVELLWAMEEAIACRAVAAVIADIGKPIKALDFTVSRRLSLRAAAAGSSAFVLRFGREREASASRLRWRISPSPSSHPVFDQRAPGAARWLVQLEKGRLGSRKDPVEWTLDWTKNGFSIVEPKAGYGPPPRAFPTLPRALPAVLGDGLSQAG